MLFAAAHPLHTIRQRVTRSLGRRRFTLTAILAALVAGVPAAHAAETYPTKPVRLVVSFPAGAGTDLVARVIGKELEKAWNQTVIVENKPGAAGNIAADFVARAPNDGYTLLLVNSTFTANVALFPNLPLHQPAPRKPSSIN